jgi:TonB family protein
MSRIRRFGFTAYVLVAAICLQCAAGEAQERMKASGTEELRSLMAAAMSAAREGDQSKLKEITHGLMIPNYEMWFKTTFGEEDGVKMAAAYQKSLEWQENWLPKLFEGLAKDQGEWEVEEVKEPDLPPTMPCQEALLKAAKNGTMFYWVGLQITAGSGTKAGRSAGYYTLVEGAYRRLDCVGMGLGIPGGMASGGPWTGPIRVGGNVQAARALYKVPPEYPKEARKKGISGTVRLHVIVAKDGSIKQLEVVSGHPLLQQAALDAVRQWRYQPTLLNGAPVEVDTTIDVIFALNQPHTFNP